MATNESGWEDVEYNDARSIIPGVFKGARVTSTSRSPEDPLSRKNPKSKHINNPNAFDMAPIRGLSFDDFKRQMADNGYEVVGGIDEVAHPSKHATGPHWHGVLQKTADNVWETVEAPEEAPSTPAAPVEGADPLAGVSPDTPDMSDPVTAALMDKKTSALSDAVAGSNLGPENVPGGSWAERVGTALATGVLPEEVRSMPLAAQIDALMRIMSATNEAIRGTPLEGVATAFPLGGLEIGGPAAVGRGMRTMSQVPEDLARLEAENPEGLQVIVSDETPWPVNDNPKLKNNPDFVVPDNDNPVGSMTAQVPESYRPVTEVPEELPASVSRDALNDNLVDYDTLANEAQKVGDPQADLYYLSKTIRDGSVLNGPGSEIPPEAISNILEQVKRDVASHPLNQGIVDNLQEALLSKIPDEALRFEDSQKTGGGPIDPPEPPSRGEELVNRLKTHISAARKTREVSEEARGAARKDKAAKLAAARQSGDGPDAIRQMKASLGGELPGKHFDPIPEESFSPDDLKELFNYVKDSPNLRDFESLHALEGLNKMFKGVVPAPRELALLEKVLGKELIAETMKHRSLGRKFFEGTTDLANLPFALMSTYDLSAFRQGAFLVSRPEFWKNAPEMGKFLFSKEGYHAAMNEIQSRPTYQAMVDADVAFADLGTDLSLREENMASRIAEKIPGIPASNRAYTGYLNKLRADVFDSIYRDFENAGVDIANSPTFLKQLGNYINDSTGRGNLGKASKYGPAMNAALFSPRLQASRINLLFRPFKYMLDPIASKTEAWNSTHPIIKKNYFRDLAGFSSAVMSTLYLAKMAGANVETDPRSSDSFKIKDGNTRHDIMAGFQQYLRLGAQLASGETKTLKGNIKTLGDGFRSETRLDKVINFFRSKGSPIATFVADYLDGKNIVGEPFEVQKAILSRLTPFSFQTFYEAYKDGEERGGPEEGLTSMMKTIDSLFGAGVQTFDVDKPRESKPEEEKAPSATVEDVTNNAPTTNDGWEVVQ